MVQGEDWGDCPDWSGEFYQLAEENMGLMAVSLYDTRTHKAPKGWTLTDIEVYEDSQVFIYRRTIGVAAA